MKAVYKKIREMMIYKGVSFSGACICNASLLDDFNST